MRKVSCAIRQLGATSHSVTGGRQNEDFYATDPNALRTFLEQTDIEKYLSNNIWECACGMGHLSEVLASRGYNVYSTDLIDRHYKHFNETIDFLNCPTHFHNGDIITNPPYKYAKDFINKAMELLDTGRYCIMLLKLVFLESMSRKELFKKYPPKYVYVSRSRIMCAKNGDFDKYDSSAVAFGWYVWQKGFIGEPVIRWID